MDETSSPEPEPAPSPEPVPTPEPAPDPEAAPEPAPTPAPSPAPSPRPAPADPALVVAVTRTGGFAGLTRRWTAEPREDEASEWIALISRCPWDERADAEPGGADRFVWRIRAQCLPDEDREADLPDRAVTGPWRELVDAVREWSSGTTA